MCAHLLNRIIRITLLTLIFATSAALLGGDAPSTAASVPQRGTAVVGQNYGVRLRKLHLVRPDLIPYPLSLEVYC